MDEGLQIRELNREEESARLSAIALAERLAVSKMPLSAQRVQAVYDALIGEADIPIEIQIAVGIAFGELILQFSDFEWVRVTDEYGSETALAPVGKHGACHPITMIQKRLARNDEVDLVELRDDTIRLLKEMDAEGRLAPRLGN